MELGLYTYLGFGSVFFVGLSLLTALFLRRVVPTNEVHIVQSSKSTTSYGKDTGHGNSYYLWPSWIPFLGVTRIILPTSVFSLNLEDYEAYDKGRLPFVIDVTAFFRIADSNVAAQRVSSFQELHNQLLSIVQGAARSVLASNDIETIMQGRSEFGDQFTQEVKGQLVHWGVEAVKNIELMDIRDHKGSNVIENIMAKKKSHIEMESRSEVAKNKRAAEIAEIEAKREIDLQSQEAKQSVGLRTIEAEQQVALSKEAAIQRVKEQEKTTKEKEMAVLQVQQTRTAEINRQTEVIKAEQEKQKTVIAAEAAMEAAKRQAEGQLELTKRKAEGITLEGTAKAEAEKALQLAPVQAQITLAKEIGENESYQKYLITIRQIEANQEVGKAQASALANADVKVNTNSGSPTQGLNGVMDLFSSKGGTELGAMLEGLAQTEVGEALVKKVVGTPTAKPVANGKGH